MTKMGETNQTPPVCPGCRETIENVELIHSQLFIGEEKADMLAYCCSRCGVVLPVQVRPAPSKQEARLWQV